MNISVSGNKRRDRKIRRGSLIYYSKQKYEPKGDINWKLMWLVCKICIPAFLMIYIFLYSSLFRVKDIIVSGNDQVEAATIIEKIPTGDNIFSLKVNDIEDNVTKQIPQIREIAIYKGIPNALKVIVVEQKGAIVWQSGISYYLLSDNGEIYEDITSTYQSYDNLPRVNDLRSLPVTVPSKIISSSFIGFVSYIMQNIKTEANIDPDYFSIDETSVDLTLYTKNGFYIKFDTLRDAKTQIDNLKLVLMQKRNDIHEYVDLRINGWAYIK